MIDYETIIHVERESIARLMVAALRAHGFNPRDVADGGLPGIQSAMTDKGLAISVPAGEANDARPLAEALLADMVRK